MNKTDLHKKILIIAIVANAIALTGPDYSYYAILRGLNFIISGFLIVKFYKENKQLLFFPSLLLCLINNIFLKTSIHKDGWAFINCLTIAFYSYLLFKLMKTEKTPDLFDGMSSYQKEIMRLKK